ncbi:thiamine diphosphokinase [Lihuaxuella thermophila]|uniref:Thiamine diphosphokinase n=1 Tax=Lihuaxuella thermophila TaxID=1173111 RepID=A0A1H8E8G2_9BACL|nr:thiamine diphosphokinase [Lihuaxuella thermophila]SEN15871.1 thiamine pyrophosphokinase [Lihuaxuella thermophila]
MSKRTAFVVAGGDVDAEDLALIDPERDWVVAADGGALTLLDAGIIPHLVVGDFDTVGEHFAAQLAARGIPIRKLPAAKAETDTHYAAREALRQNPDEVIILGALGGSRFDHTLANLGLLEWLDEQGVQGILYHRSNRIRLVSGPGEAVLAESKFSFVSLIPVTAAAEGITTVGMLYPLRGETLLRGMTRGISNEIVGREGKIIIEKGKCLLVESRD